MNDGGPAFPQHSAIGEVGSWHRGMSLRDYYIAHAPIGVVDFTKGQAEIDIQAIRACRWADALLKAREEPS